MQTYCKKDFCLTKNQKQTAVSEIHIQNYLSLGREVVTDAGRARAQVSVR